MNAVTVSPFRGRRLEPASLDLAVGLVLVAIAVVADVTRGVGAVALLARVVCVSTVIWRQRAPASACMVALVSVAVFQRMGNASDLQVATIAIVLDCYVLGRRGADGGRLVAVGLVLVSGATIVAIGPDGSSVVDVVAVWGCFAVLPLAMGWAVERRNALAVELRASTERLVGEQREVAQRAAGEERARVARELHDIVAHGVSVMVIQAVAARRVAMRDRERAHEALSTVETCGREALTEMRRMIGVLRRDPLEPAHGAVPGLAQIDALAARARASGLPVEVEIDGHARLLPSAVELTAFRVIQEALTNAIKHAGRASARVRIAYHEDALELEVSDTGHGPRSTLSGQPPGSGLVGMAERVGMYGGELRAGAHGSGFRVSARIPLGLQPDRAADAAQRLARWPLRHLDGPAFDRLLALALLVVGETELLLSRGVGSDRTVDGLLLAALTIPIAWRRAAPLAFVCVTMVIAVVCAIKPIDVFKLQTPTFVALIPPYTVAAYAHGRRALIGLAVCVAGLELAVLIGHAGGVSAIFMLGASTLSWWRGRTIRSRRALVEQLTRTAGKLDDERQSQERLAVVDERSRIARELQAVVARSVSAMIVQSQAVQRLLDVDPSKAEEAMTEIERTGREALTEMRRLLGVLRDTERDADLRPQPGVGQLHTLVEHSRAAGRDVELRVKGAPRPLPPSVDLGVYRIIEEALTGTADTASPAAPVAVVLRFTDTHVALILTISWPAPISWPTATMRERIALCNGEVNINTASDATDQLRVRLPGTLTGALATG